MNVERKNEVIALLEKLIKTVKRCKPEPDPDLPAARRIAADMSRQTGKNYENFESGRYDHAFGVRTALAAIKYGRENPL